MTCNRCTEASRRPASADAYWAATMYTSLKSIGTTIFWMRGFIGCSVVTQMAKRMPLPDRSIDEASARCGGFSENAGAGFPAVDENFTAAIDELYSGRDA